MTAESHHIRCPHSNDG